VLALNLYNPDARIARVNLARAEAGRVFDAAYLRELSADAAPALAAAAPGLMQHHPDVQVRCDVHRALQAMSTRAAVARDWRSWSWSRWRAEVALASVAAPAALADACPPSDR
jgi:hypothetical protein